MANLNGDIKKLRRGEIIGTAATIVCGVALVYFIVCFAVARTQNLETLQIVTLITAPVIMIAGAAVAALCNIRYGGALDKSIKKYVVDECIENASLLHPEKSSLSFYLSLEESTVVLQINNYKEKISFDFSALGKISPFRKAFVLAEIENRLLITFLRLYDRGSEYSDVSYSEQSGTRRKSGKRFYIIKDGTPDKKAYKCYLKNR